MAKLFDDLIKRTTTRKTQVRATRRTQELLEKMLLNYLFLSIVNARGTSLTPSPLAPG